MVAAQDAQLEIWCFLALSTTFAPPFHWLPTTGPEPDKRIHPPLIIPHEALYKQRPRAPESSHVAPFVAWRVWKGPKVGYRPMAYWRGAGRPGSWQRGGFLTARGILHHHSG